jgi:hypothetical protein
MKKVTLSEGDLKNLISKSLKKTLSESDFSVEPDVPQTKRETGLKNVFGSYSSEIPNDVVRYMRKNPRLIIRRLMELYGENFFDYVGEVSSELRNEE